MFKLVFWPLLFSSILLGTETGRALSLSGVDLIVSNIIERDVSGFKDEMVQCKKQGECNSLNIPSGILIDHTRLNLDGNAFYVGTDLFGRRYITTYTLNINDEVWTREQKVVNFFDGK